MPSFTLDGVTYEYDRGDPGEPAMVHSWEYGHYPKISATITHTAGTFTVYAHAERWNPTHILARWDDDERRPHTAWIPAGNVRRVTDSEWDIWEYHRCPEKLRGVRWSQRMPGFLPN